MPKRTRNYHEWLYERLVNPIFAAEYVNAAAEDSPEMLLVAMRNVAEAHKMSRVALGANVNRESLYKTLSREGNPRLETLASILDVFGLKIAVVPKKRAARTPRRARQSPATKSTQRSSARSRRK
jgi:probable addiction module antidote protein